jgi:hypothetical protein
MTGHVRTGQVNRAWEYRPMASSILLMIIIGFHNAFELFSWNASRSICPLEAGGRLVSRGVRRVDHAHTAWIVAR